MLEEKPEGEGDGELYSPPPEDWIERVRQLRDQIAGEWGRGVVTAEWIACSDCGRRARVFSDIELAGWHLGGHRAGTDLSPGLLVALGEGERRSTRSPVTAWRKLLRGYRESGTRLHTARGQLIPLSAWLELPVIFWRRLRKSQLKGPWMVPSAVRWLNRNITLDASVLELGSGSSTVWFARRAARVISFEDKPDWWKTTTSELDSADADNCELHLVELAETPDQLDKLPQAGFDLVVVDSNRTPEFTRMDGVRLTQRLVRPGGYLLLDDSDRSEYADADQMLEGWEVRRFVGLKQFPLMATETSVYRKPA